jgi:opacity protein-like surface antigen
MPFHDPIRSEASMKARQLSLIAGTALLVLPAHAYACGFPFSGTYLARSSGKMAFGGTLGFTTSDPSVTVVTGDLSINLGPKAVVRPAIGICRAGGGEGGESSSELMFGGDVGVNFWNNADGKVALNVQSGLSILSVEGATDMTIPITVAGQFKANENTSIYGGAGVSHNRFKYSSGSPGASDETFTATDPVVYGGVAITQPRARFTAGLQMLMGDSKTFFTIIGGVQIPLGTT